MSDKELLPCPFCGKTVGDDLDDILYPNGSHWREQEEGRAYFSRRKRVATDGTCYSMHCTQNMGGCGAEITGDSEAEAIEAWNRRAQPPTDEGEREIIATYNALHKDKLGAHWLWVVIEQIAAGMPEDEAMEAFGYFEPAKSLCPPKRPAGEVAKDAGWRDIESAPRDTAVWTFGINGHGAMIHHQAQMMIAWQWVDIELRYLEPYPEWPTHWRPLPAPPSAANEGMTP